MKPHIKYAVCLFDLDSNDKGFAMGARAMIEDIDRERFYLKSMDDAQQFIKTHGMIALSDADMAELRRETAKRNRKKRDIK